MAKAKKHKEKKPRPDKYAEKVHINTSFGDAMQVLADHANKMVADHIEEAKIEEPPHGE